MHRGLTYVEVSLQNRTSWKPGTSPIVVWDLDITDVVTTKCLSRTVKTFVIGSVPVPVTVPVPDDDTVFIHSTLELKQP